jgi:glycosyltransferase involved in cell wall biosynthesis
LARLPRPRIGYFGLIYEKLDFGLLAAVAQRFGAGSLALIGPRTYAPEEFDRLANVHFLGQKPYEELPRYLAGLDVLLLPYVSQDEMIRRSGPLKLRECLASGKPTVSVDVPEVRVLEPHVRVGRNHQEFVGQVERALEEPADSPLAQARRKAVEHEGWDDRARQLASYLEDLRPGRRTIAASSTNGHSTNGHSADGRQRPGRVLHLRTVSGVGGGPEKTILNSPRFLQGRYELRLAYIRPEGDPDYNMPRRAREIGADLVDVPERSGVDPRTFWRLVREVREFRPDILHAHDYKTNVLAVLLGRWFGIRTLTTMHGYVSRGGRLEVYYRLDRWALRQMDHVIAVSEDLHRMLLDFRIPPERRSIIPNAIDVQQFARQRSVAEARAHLGMDSSRLVVGAVGRLAAEKGFDLLIQAVDRLLVAGVDAELIVIGEGDERPRLEALIAQLRRGDRIRLFGYRPDVRDLFEALDVFALSSLREGLPNVLLEAMALEVPVLATRIAGVPGLIDDGVNGLLVRPGSVEELTRGLGRLLGDAELRQRLSHAGRETIVGRYNFAARMSKIAAIYDGLLSSNSLSKVNTSAPRRTAAVPPGNRRRPPRPSPGTAAGPSRGR